MGKPKKSGRTRRVLRWSLAAVLLLILGAGGWYAHRFFDAPPHRDLEAEYAALEDAYTGVAYDESAYAEFRAATEAVLTFDEAWAESLDFDEVMEHDYNAFGRPDVSARHTDFAHRMEPASLAWYDARTEDLLRAYTSSDLPARLTAALARNTLRPPPMFADQPLDTNFMFTRVQNEAIRMARDFELVRLERAIETGEDDDAVEAGTNLLRLADFVAASPMTLTQSMAGSMRQRCFARLIDAIESGALSPIVARALLPLVIEQDRLHTERAPFVMAGEHLVATGFLRSYYANVPDSREYIETPRALWGSHADNQSVLDAYHEALTAYGSRGHLGTPPYPEEFVPSGARTEPYAPYSDAVSSPRRTHGAIYVSMAQTRVMLVGLACVAYFDKHGAAPVSLKRLVEAGVLERVPDDPAADRPSPLFYTRSDAHPFGFATCSFLRTPYQNDTLFGINPPPVSAIFSSDQE